MWLSTGADGQVLQWHVANDTAPTHTQRHVLTWQGPLLAGKGSVPRQPTIGRAVGGTALAATRGGAAVGCEDGTVVLLTDTAAGGCGQSPPVWHAHLGAVTALQWLGCEASSTTLVLASAGADGGIALWSVPGWPLQGTRAEVLGGGRSSSSSNMMGHC